MLRLMERSSSKGTRADSVLDFDNESEKRYRYGGNDADRGSRYGGGDADRGSRYGGGDADRGSRYGGVDADRGSRYGGARPSIAGSRFGAESSASRHIAEDESVHNLWTTVDMTPHREKWRKKFRHSRYRVVGTL